MTPIRDALPIAEVLPKRVRDELVAASRIENEFDRSRAIDRILAMARTNHPRLFKQELKQ